MQNVSEEFKATIASPSPEFKSRITFPGLVLDDYQIKSINLDSLLVGGDDFEIGTAPMDMVKVELVEDTGDEWGRNLFHHPDINGEEEYELPVYKGVGSFKQFTNCLTFDPSETVGEKYTISFWAKSPNGKTPLSIYNSNSNPKYFYIPPTTLTNSLSDEWQFFKITIINEEYKGSSTPSMNPKLWRRIEIYAPNQTGVLVKKIKVEKGDIATPWTPAPEDYANYDYKNKECDIELGLTLPDESVEYVSIGKFTVENAVRKNNTITLNCVDRMYKAEKDYVSDLMYPTTLGEILQSACDQAGIELATTTFANSDYIVLNEPVFEGVTCRKVFAQVAELAGGYAKINRLGQLEIVTLGNESVRDITKDHYFDLKINEVAEASIDKVIVKVGEETATKGDGENIYTVVDNMFVQDPNSVVDALYSVLKNVSYTACTLKWQGDFSLDLGDKVTVDGNDTYVLSRKLTYTGGLREDYSAPAKSNIEKESTGKGSLTLDIENVKTQVKVLSGEISQTIERVENLAVGANNRLFDSQTGIEFGFNSGSGTIQLFRHQIHPYYKVVSNGNIDLFAAFPDSQFAEPLGELGEVTISLEVLVEVDRKVNIDGKEFDVKGNRWTRIHVTKEFNEENTTKRLRVRNPFSRKHTRDTEIGTRLIESLSTNINTLYYRNLKVERGNVVTEWTLTPEELEGQINRYQSEIKQLADEISLRVTTGELESIVTMLSDEISSKVSRGQVISEINQTPEQVRISADKIKLEGAVTANENFKVLQDGSIEAKNATIEGDITSENANIKGRITATSGKVGGYDISGNNLVGNDITLGINEIYIGASRIFDNFLQSENTNSLSLDSRRIQLGTANNSWVFIGDGAIIIGSGVPGVATGYFGDLIPRGSSKQVGTPSQRWKYIFLENHPDISSDIRLKKEIQDIPKDLIEFLKEEVKPKMYLQGDKWHFGYIAQDVERAIYKYALNKVGFENAREYAKNFALLHKDESYLSLLYGEIAVLKDKEKQDRIDELEERISKLEKIINEK